MSIEDPERDKRTQFDSGSSVDLGGLKPPFEEVKFDQIPGVIEMGQTDRPKGLVYREGGLRKIALSTLALGGAAAALVVFKPGPVDSLPVVGGGDNQAIQPRNESVQPQEFKKPASFTEILQKNQDAIVISNSILPENILGSILGYSDYTLSEQKFAVECSNNGADVVPVNRTFFVVTDNSSGAAKKYSPLPKTAQNLNALNQAYANFTKKPNKNKATSPNGVSEYVGNRVCRPNNSGRSVGSTSLISTDTMATSENFQEIVDERTKDRLALVGVSILVISGFAATGYYGLRYYKNKRNTEARISKRDKAIEVDPSFTASPTFEAPDREQFLAENAIEGRIREGDTFSQDLVTTEKRVNRAISLFRKKTTSK